MSIITSSSTYNDLFIIHCVLLWNFFFVELYVMRTFTMNEFRIVFLHKKKTIMKKPFSLFGLMIFCVEALKEEKIKYFYKSYSDVQSFTVIFFLLW